MVARTALIGLLLPSDLVSTSLTPAASSTARTPPPAITPVPGAAGFNSTRDAPKSARISWGMVVPIRGTRMTFLRGVVGALADGIGHLTGLAGSGADHAVAIAHDHHRAEAEAAATLDHLRHAVHLNHALFQIQPGCINSRRHKLSDSPS